MISLILPYWERQEALDKALWALVDAYYGELDLEVVVVDDGSPTPCRLPKDYPLRHQLVRLPAKDVALNPCVPINAGVKAARGDVIVLSNPEIIHEHPILGEMLAQLKVLGPDGYVLAAAWCPEQNAWHCHSSISGDRPSGERQPAGSGFHFCAMLYRPLWDRAGGFDEEYRDGAGYDDPDWVNRLAMAGAKFRIRDDLIVTHPKTGATTRWQDGGHERNHAMFMRKWQSAPMLNVVCVNWGNYGGCGAEYVNKLYSMVARNLRKGTPGRFICFTDNPEGIDNAISVRELPGGLDGWWNKLALFRAGEFPAGERVVFFDLDTLIVGPLDDIVAWDGDFAILRDFYRPNGLGSGVMSWRAGAVSDIWDAWEAADRPMPAGGDQAWIEQWCLAKGYQPAIWQDLFPGLYVSYKVHCNPLPPQAASVVCFHGEPKPHNAGERWVTETWSHSELAGTSLEIEQNTHLGRVRAQVGASAARGLPRLKSKPAHGRHVALIGGGPSIKRKIEEIRNLEERGCEVWALNGTHGWLHSKLIVPEACVILDARKENAEFVRLPSHGTRYYIASQCHADVYDALKGYQVTRFDLDVMGDCGTTVGTYAMMIAYIEGFRHIHLYGFDSSYEEDVGHAYEQPINSRDRIITVHVGDRTFRAAPWMARQAQDFVSLVPDFINAGAEISVHGDGLIPYIAQEMNRPHECSETGVV